MRPLRPESKNSFRLPAPASRKSCAVCWRPRKNRIIGSWRTGKQSKQGQARHRATRPRRRNPGRSIGCSPGESEKPNLNERALCSCAAGALDLVEIWRYIKEQTSLTIADRVESAIREKMAFPLHYNGP